MVVRIQTQARKKAKLTPYLDVVDFQIILLAGLVVPVSAWMLMGFPWSYTIWPVLLYIAWIMMFKINKPAGYGGHYCKYQIRGKAWTSYGNQPPHPVYSRLRHTQPTR